MKCEHKDYPKGCYRVRCQLGNECAGLETLMKEPADHIGDADKMVATDTTTYTDGTTATGPMPLPRSSPEQQSDEQACRMCPKIPSHPEPYAMKWTTLELETIADYGDRCFLAGRQSSRKDAEDAAWEADKQSDKAWLDGARFGWNCGVSNDTVNYDKTIKSRRDQLAFAVAVAAQKGVGK